MILLSFRLTILPMNFFIMAQSPPLLFLVLPVILFLVSFTIFPPCMSLMTETQALLQLKTHLEDPLRSLGSWVVSDSPCGFSGITCDPVSGEVTEISLDNKSLSGEIFPSVSSLQELKVLSLPSNLISGKLPSEISNCSNLRVLNLTGNQMVGRIPDLSGLRNLEVLDLSANYFTGRFPSWIGNLTGLLSLGLGENEYLESEIPESIGNLKNLTWLYIGGSHLRGEIPESIFEMTALQTLDISRNRISGKLSKSISKLKKLYKIELFQNNLIGEVPPEIANLTLLQEIDISANKMYGKLPKELGNLKNLVVFQLYDNNFSGELPDGFGEMQNLIGFSIYKNNFTGTFPQNLGRLSPLESIDISENQFSGLFPKFFCEKRKLIFLLALENSFSGELPDSYAGCKSLVRFRISKNHLFGKIPDGVWALPYVNIIDFGDNEFSGGISADLGFSASLNQLLLMNNRFSSKLPSEIGKLINLEKLYLNNNSFSGEIPPQIGALKQLSSLHLEENSLTGLIPMELGHCSRLVDLNLAWNSLNGNIPLSVSAMNSLNSLNLSGNKLTGSIPKDLGTLKLSSIDLSVNQFSGEIPSDLLVIGGEKAFVGNKGLCVSQDSKMLSPNSSFNYCTGKHGHKYANTLVLLCLIATGLVVVLVGLLLVSYRKLKRGEREIEANFKPEKEVDAKWKLSSFHQVDIDVNEICNLEEQNMIGSGATGKVYRVELKKGGATVAVKQLWKGDGLKILAAEMDILGKIRHRNILKLYACLLKGGSNYLVLEYMANGNLFQALHQEFKSGLPEVDWYQRHKIALGAAKGIAYLHHDCSPPIVHRDIKSSNILLDEDYEPKIADFGMARIAERTIEKGSDNSCFAGTHGYIAPEHAYTLEVTEKSDVYSFGVVLLELITGRKPIEEDYGEGRDIVCWVSTHLNDRKTVLNVLDHKVVSDSVKDDMIKVLKVAILCTTKLPSLRPTMREVVKMLVNAEPGEPPENNSDKDRKILL